MRSSATKVKTTCEAPHGKVCRWGSMQEVKGRASVSASGITQKINMTGQNQIANKQARS